VDYIFEKDATNPSTVLVHANRLAVPEGLEQYATVQESAERNEVYNIQALLNAFRMRQLCAVDNLITSGESLLHAHAELFLSRGYAAWNLTGKSKTDFEERLKRFTDPTLSKLFLSDTPVCSAQENEILQASDLRERLLELERENVNFKAIAEQAAEEMVDLRDQLQEKIHQMELMETNLKSTIDAALAGKQRELEKLQEATDLIVATALQEHQDAQKTTELKETSDLISLEAYSKNLEKRNKQLEHYLVLAKDALIQSKAEGHVQSNQDYATISKEKKSECVLQ
jgi:hypothetical protein